MTFVVVCNLYGWRRAQGLTAQCGVSGCLEKGPYSRLSGSSPSGPTCPDHPLGGLCRGPPSARVHAARSLQAGRGGAACPELRRPAESSPRGTRVYAATRAISHHTHSLTHTRLLAPRSPRQALSGPRPTRGHGFASLAAQESRPQPPAPRVCPWPPAQHRLTPVGLAAVVLAGAALRRARVTGQGGAGGGPACPGFPGSPAPGV